MSWIDSIALAEIHRETYIAILKSWISHGKKGKFARRVGITQEYFSYLCALDHPASENSKLKRLPSPKLARKMAEALPAPKEVRESLLENMALAHVSASRAHYKTREFLAEKRVNEALAVLEQWHRNATFGSDLDEVRQAYRTVRDAAALLIPRLSPDLYPVSLAQACLYLHDAQCILDRADDALRYASLARFVLENTDPYEERFRKEEIDNTEINAVRGQGVAYHNLGLDRQAQTFFLYATTTSAYKNSGKFWEPIVSRDVVNSLAATHRFSIREAKKRFRGIEAACEYNNDELTLFLAKESWLRCLIKKERWSEAQKVYRDEIDRLPKLPYVGKLHQALLLKTGAELAWNLKDKSVWNKRISEAIALMGHAGLSHQLHSVKKNYGIALKPILVRLEL